MESNSQSQYDAIESLFRKDILIIISFSENAENPHGRPIIEALFFIDLLTILRG